MDVIAYLQKVEGFNVKVAFGRAVSGFRMREERDPDWVEVGAGVQLPLGVTGQLGGLRRVSGRGCRAGCLLVGVDLGVGDG